MTVDFPQLQCGSPRTTRAAKSKMRRRQSTLKNPPLLHRAQFERSVDLEIYKTRRRPYENATKDSSRSEGTKKGRITQGRSHESLLGKQKRRREARQRNKEPKFVTMRDGRAAIRNRAGNLGRRTQVCGLVGPFPPALLNELKTKIPPFPCERTFQLLRWQIISRKFYNRQRGTGILFQK